MSINKYKDDIIKLISENGPMGVNAIQRELDVPVSTLQKYLHRQSYFRINEDKKWDLPENVIGNIKNTSLVLMVNVIENSILLLRSQLEETLQQTNNALSPISTLKKGIDAIGVPVATIKSGQSNIDPRLIRLSDNAQRIKEVFKKQKANIPDEYQNILFNFDYLGLVMKDGEDYTNNFIEGDIYALLAGKDTTLTEDTISILKENQLGE